MGKPKSQPKKPKGSWPLISTSNGNTGARKTTIHGKVTRDQKPKKK